MVEEEEKARKACPERLRRRCSFSPSVAREGLSSEFSYTETRGALQAANAAAAAPAQLAGPAPADVPRLQPPLRGQRSDPWSGPRRDRCDAAAGPAHRT